jgi:hypothetical protein
MRKTNKYLASFPKLLLNDTRLTHRQRVLMYSDLDSINRQPSDEELKRLYAILYHDKDIAGLTRFAARFDLDRLYPDETPELPQVTEKQMKKYFNEIWKTVRRVNPNVKKVPSKEKPMERFPKPERQYIRRRMPGSPSLTEYFYTDADGTVYFLKRSFLEDQSKKWLLAFARKNDIFVTTPQMIKGSTYDISLNGLILQIMDDPCHVTALVEAMQKRRPKLAAADADAILSGEYITIDK